MSTEISIVEALKLGVEAHRSGKIEEADRYYTAILKAQPDHPDANHNMGVLAVGLSKVEEALPFFTRALEANRSIEQFWLSYVDALIRLDRVKEAQAVLDQAKESEVTGDGFDKLEQRLDTSKSGKPDKQISKTAEAEALANKGLSKLREQDDENALEELEKAHSLDPQIKKIWNPLINLKFNMQDYAGAANLLKGMLAIEPRNLNLKKILISCLKKNGDTGFSAEILNYLINLNSKEIGYYVELGSILYQAEDFAGAIKNFKEALKINPGLAVVQNNLGLALQKIEKNDEAMACFEKAIDLNPESAEAHNNLGLLTQKLGNYEDAIVSFKNAEKLLPNSPYFNHNLGVIYNEMGNIPLATVYYKKALKHKPDYGEVHRLLSLVTDYGTDDVHLQQMITLKNSGKLSGISLCQLNFGIAKAYEDLKKFKKAFEIYLEANLQRRNLFDYDANNDHQALTLSKITQPEFDICGLKNLHSKCQPIPIFLVGMPRSGSTLLEQMLSSHSSIFGAGELPFVQDFGSPMLVGKMNISTENIRNFREKFISQTSNITGECKYIVDKMGLNFRFLPLIIAAFPEAKILHLKRNPYANCWSLFKTYFAADSLKFSYNLTDIVSFYQNYVDLMDFFESLYAKSIINLSYERLVTTTETEISSIFENLNLAIEEPVLTPHKNNRPVKTASRNALLEEVHNTGNHQWKKFENSLNFHFLQRNGAKYRSLFDTQNN